ncbi:hypothetical protein IC582_025888 [Cucumis melo]
MPPTLPMLTHPERRTPNTNFHSNVERLTRTPLPCSPARRTSLPYSPNAKHYRIL